MAYFLFVDESGQDQRESPYEVLAGVGVQDQDLWNLVKALQDAEIRHFGIRYSDGNRELKAKKLLKRKVFKHAAQLSQMDERYRPVEATAALLKGNTATKSQLTALAQAKLAYVLEVFELCSRYRVKLFASIVKTHIPNPNHRADYLRKDYAYLFERFFYFLEDTDTSAQGIVVFDELEKTKSRQLVNHMDSYFKKTSVGRLRAAQIIPEPFFVHSDLTTGIQIADLVAYIVSWGFRTSELDEPARAELNPYVDLICRLRHRAVRDINGNSNFVIWSFAVTDIQLEQQN